MSHIHHRRRDDDPWGMIEDTGAEEEYQGLLGGREQQQAYIHSTHADDLLERREQIDGITKEISDVQEIFQDFATLVKNQEVQIDDIESNILDTQEKTEEALREVRLASDYTRRRRNALCYALLFFLLVLVVIGLFIYELSDINSS